MAEHSTPTGRLPDPVSRKTVAPGPNSWAQQRDSTTKLITNAKPTNRDKYEHKPMPPPPQSEEDRFGDHYFLQPKAYVRPASPLASSTTPNMPNQKNRAVTDPVAPKPLFADREVSVRQLRKKYSQSKGKDQPSKEPSFEDSQASSKIPMTSEKAAQILGVNPVAGISRNAHPTSTPNESASDFFRSSNGESVERRVTPAQQIQSSPVPRRSTPVPTRRYLKENDLPALPSTEASSGPQQYSDEQEQDEVHASKKAQKQEINKALLHPARIGTNTNIGEVGLVEGSGMHRVESFRGVIEDVPTSSGSNGQVYTESYASSSQPSTGRGQDAERVGPSYSYAPGNYGGVWENDPAVVSIFRVTLRMYGF